MEDKFVLLKIKREFTENEAVLSLLKIVKDLQLEIGMLKSENEEVLDEVKILKAKAERPERLEQNINGSISKPKKEWLKDELIAAQDKQIKEMQAKISDVKKNYKYWQNKYCLLASQSVRSSI
jgi:hypothetical protein